MADDVRLKQKTLSDEQIRRMTNVKQAGQALLDAIGSGATREAALARTKAEESVMWALKGITG